MRSTLLAVLLLATSVFAQTGEHCDNLPRPANAALERHPASTDWFEIFAVGDGVYALLEPYQWQEVISYVVVGADRALLIDTGNGIGDIAAVVRRLTDKPLLVINTHSHYDHVGGNHQFDDIAALDTTYGRTNESGYDSALVRDEVSVDVLCRPLPANRDVREHSILPYAVTKRVGDGETIDLGGRHIEVLHIPGHTPDSIALLDREHRQLWTGDTVYPDTIWLFDPVTDYEAYRQSLQRLAALAGEVDVVYPAHYVVVDGPGSLVTMRDAFEQVMRGEVTAQPDADTGMWQYDFGDIGFLMQPDHPKDTAR